MGHNLSNLIRKLCTLLLPTSGRALVDGYDIIKQASEIRPRIGLVDCQERSFFWRLTGQQNLEFFAALHNLHGAQAQKRIYELMELVGMREYADQRFSGYSTGMRQQLAIARGLLAMPPIIFMDEPTRSLDPVNAHELRTFIRKTLVDKMGRTVVLVTHRLEEAESLCDRIAIIDRGKLLTSGSIQHIKNHITARRQYQFMVSNLPQTSLSMLQAIPGVNNMKYSQNDHQLTKIEFRLAEAGSLISKITQHIFSHGASIESVETRDISLEDAFIHLIKGDQNNA